MARYSAELSSVLARCDDNRLVIVEMVPTTISISSADNMVAKNPAASEVRTNEKPRFSGGFTMRPVISHNQQVNKPAVTWTIGTT